MTPRAAGSKRAKDELGYCLWSQDDEGGMWETSCGRAFEFNDGTPRENGALFCLYCGKHLHTPAKVRTPKRGR